MPYFEYNGAKIYYEKKGNWNTDKYPVVLLHGNGESMEIYDKPIAKLLDKLPFLAIDTRGHGKSEITNSSLGLSYSMFADDVFALIKHLNIGQFDIVGFSDGGIVALMLAIRRESAIHIMRVIAIGANLNPDGMKNSALRMIKNMKRKADLSGEAFESALCDLMLTQPDISKEDLAKIYASVAVVVGSNDMIKESHSELIANSTIHGRLLIIEGADHMIPQNHPKELGEIIYEELV